MRFIVFLCAFVCLIEVVFGQAIGFNGGHGIPNNLPMANSLAPCVPTPNGLAPGIPGPGLGMPGMPVSPLSPAGFGEVAVVGELPVGGSTAVVGNVPIIGFVTFEGIVPANGMVSLASNCECNSLI